MSIQPAEPAGLRLSFIGLIDRYGRVEIPLMQRDYAQGRKSAAVVRERFLAHLLRALREEEPLSLDFVYGEVAEHRGFQPIDGQQRLTTLFLLHWLLACTADRVADFRQAMREESSGEARFRYAVRTSSHRFFSHLLDHAPKNLADPPSKEIRESAWFFRAWEHDPTIVGALNMLDAIQEKFVGEPGLADFYARLTRSDHPPITMDVLSLGELGLSDEIYVKMNARGKELTGFEKFKAWLIETHATLRWPLEVTDGAQWTILLDGEWLDLFWRFQHEKPEPAKSVSQVYFRTVVALAVNFRASAGDEIQKEWFDADKSDQETLWADLFTAPCVGGVFEKLHCLSSGGGSGGCPVTQLRGRLERAGVGPFDKKPLDRAFFDDEAAAVTYGMRLWLHAIGVFLGSKKACGGSDETHWFRVVRNLLQNRRAISETDFGNAIRGMDVLGQLALAENSVLSVVAGAGAVAGLSGGQWSEEQRKAQLMNQPESGDEWEKMILAVEAHPVLTGQIELLLPAAGEDALKEFRQRWDVFGRLWGENGSRLGGKDEMLLARAVLAHSGPIKLGAQQRIYLDDQSSRWSELLGRHCQWEPFRRGALALIDSLVGVEEPESALRKTLETVQAGEPWMQDVIRYGDVLFKESSKKKVQQYYGDGVFVFSGENWTEQTILLGKTAALRNFLIERLSDGEQASWEIESGAASWRRVPVGEPPVTVFYRGYLLTLVRKNNADGDGAVCTMGYDQVEISVARNSASKIKIPYPANGDLRAFRQSLDGELASARPETKPVLLELEMACDAGSE